MTRLFLALAVLVVLALAFRWWSGSGQTAPAGDVAAAIASGAQVLDVRTDAEYASGHVMGAVHANVLGSDFEAQVDGLARDEPVYVYCASGHRSGRAASKMEAMGFTEVINAGGFGDLAGAGAPTER